MNHYLETQRPSEWLAYLMEADGTYAALVEDSGSLARAAYRLARARCRTRPLPTNLPSARELGAAATELCEVLKLVRPSPLALAQECERLGLRVILPLTRNAA